MLYSCPTPACVEVMRERARMLTQDQFTPNRQPDPAAEIAKQAIDHALSCVSPEEGCDIRQDMIRAAATMILAIEVFDLETKQSQDTPALVEA